MFTEITQTYHPTLLVLKRERGPDLAIRVFENEKGLRIFFGVNTQGLIESGYFRDENKEIIGIDADAWLVRMPDKEVGAVYSPFTPEDCDYSEEYAENVIIKLKNQFGAISYILRDGNYSHNMIW